jgi:hypothetical protein
MGQVQAEIRRASEGLRNAERGGVPHHNAAVRASGASRRRLLLRRARHPQLVRRVPRRRLGSSSFHALDIAGHAKALRQHEPGPVLIRSVVILKGKVQESIVSQHSITAKYHGKVRRQSMTAKYDGKVRRQNTTTVNVSYHDGALFGVYGRHQLLIDHRGTAQT